MKSLPEDIIKLIQKYVDFDGLYNMLFINKTINKTINKIIYKNFNIYKKNIRNNKNKELNN